MPDRRKNLTPTSGLRLGGGSGFGPNRECRNCTPPCQGGEVLHKRGYCSHSYCLCTAFEPVKGTTIVSALNQSVYFSIRHGDKL